MVSQWRTKVKDYCSCCRTIGDFGPGQLIAGLLSQLYGQIICNLEAKLSLDVVDDQSCCMLTLLDAQRGWDWFVVHITGTHETQHTDGDFPVVWVGRVPHDPD